MKLLPRMFAGVGIGCLGIGLLLSMMEVTPDPLPRLMIIAGLLLLAAWPAIALPRLRGAAVRATMPVVVGCTLVLVAIVLVNVLAARYSARWDTTRTGAFTLSPQTRQVLDALPAPVEAIAFVQDDARDIADLLTEYAASSGNFSFRTVDPDRRPEEAQAYNIRDYDTVVLSLGDRRERLAKPTEQSVTSALMRLTENRQIVVQLLAGHGERGRDRESKDGIGVFGAALQDENYLVNDLLLLRDGIPSTDDVIIIPGPTSSFLMAEMESLATFANHGGRLLVLLEPGGPSMEPVLRPRGISARADVIVDASGVGSLFGMSEVVPLVADYDPDHPLTKDFAAASFFPLCRSLAVSDSVADPASVTCLASTGESSWGETGPLPAEKVTFDADETKGPLCVCAAASWAQAPGTDSLAPPREGRLVVFGDVDFLSNAFIDISGNRDLALNVVSWLAERSELIAVRPRTAQGAYLTLTPQAARSIFFLVVIVLPGAVLAAGIAVRVRKK